MSDQDPSDCRLRGEISAAVKNRRPELERELRRELALRNTERSFEKYLGGLGLSLLELRRLRLALESYGAAHQLAEPEPDPELVASVRALPGQVVAMTKRVRAAVATGEPISAAELVRS